MEGREGPSARRKAERLVLGALGRRDGVQVVEKIQRASVEARGRREMLNIPVHLGGDFGAEPTRCLTWDGRPLAAPTG